MSRLAPRRDWWARFLHSYLREVRERRLAKKQVHPSRVTAQQHGNEWELVHPRCAEERQDDLEEVQSMIDAGEMEVAVDELRWLLEECGDFISGHYVLGQLALLEDDFGLARGHFGYAFRTGLKALGGTEKFHHPLPYAREANREFLEAGKGLAWCLFQLGKKKIGKEVVGQLLKLDPADPLGVAAWRNGLPGAPSKSSADDPQG